jgi:hypothetical protein
MRRTFLALMVVNSPRICTSDMYSAAPTHGLTGLLLPTNYLVDRMVGSTRLGISRVLGLRL